MLLRQGSHACSAPTDLPAATSDTSLSSQGSSGEIRYSVRYSRSLLDKAEKSVLIRRARGGELRRTRATTERLAQSEGRPFNADPNDYGNSMVFRIAIVGGGIAGASLFLALKGLDGVEVTVFDGARELRSVARPSLLTISPSSTR